MWIRDDGGKKASGCSLAIRVSREPDRASLLIFSVLEGEMDGWAFRGLFSLNRLKRVDEWVVSVGSGSLLAGGMAIASFSGIWEFEANWGSPVRLYGGRLGWST